jgi:hypothetical protein
MTEITADYTMKQLIFYFNMISFNMILHDQKGEMDIGINWAFGDTADTPDGSYRNNDEDIIVLFLTVWVNQQRKLTPTFKIIRDLLSNPDLPILTVSKIQPLAFFGMKIGKTIRFADEHEDQYIIDIETGTTKWIKNEVGSGTIVMTKEQQEHIAFMALTHYNRISNKH